MIDKKLTKFKKSEVDFTIAIIVLVTSNYLSSNKFFISFIILVKSCIK